LINPNVKYIFLSITLLISSLNAQRILSTKPEAGVKNPERVYNEIEIIDPDSLVFISENDTLFIQTSDGDSLDIPLEESSIKDDLLDMLYGAIFRDSTKNKYMDESNLTESEEKYVPYQGQIIANIYISKVPVFGGSVDDTLDFTVSSIERFGNSLHINTKDWVIYNNLFIREGDQVQPFELADNERILRRLPFIRDARILIVPRTEDDKVDVLVITRDVFSLGLSINAGAVDDIAISIFDRNLFGNGWRFRNTFRYRSEFEQKVDYEGIFDINNIQGSFIGMTLKYIYAHDQQQGWMRFYKEYLTPETKYAGGIDFIRTTLKDELQEFKTITQISNTYDFWSGRSFLLGGEGSRRTIKVGARYFRKTFDERPIVLADSNFSYHSQKLYLANIMLDKREYFTSSMIYGFGITEDIPTGYAYELTGGFSDEEFKNRPYVGLDVRIASWFDDVGYMSFGTQAATYINNGSSEDGLISIFSQYFSPLMESGRYRFRHFLFANYVTGINRFDDRLIDIRDEDGIRGLSNDRMDGVERLIFNLESVAFTPWNLIGFQFSMYTFADLGWISPDKGIFNETNFSSAIGFGFRIRNEGLVFQTLNLRIAYFPSVPSGANHFGYDISTTDPVSFPRFSRGKPRILPFE
jgi:hypothetical protein